MRFSTKSEYGLRAIIHVAQADNKPVSLAYIAKQEGLSLAYLERIFAKLKKADLITSFKGANGGYLLSRKAKQITVADIIMALEGNLYEFKCQSCKFLGCKVNYVWSKLNDQISKTLKSITLDKLI